MAYMRERQSKWDRRHLVTVSTHLNDRDYDLLRAACRAVATVGIEKGMAAAPPAALFGFFGVVAPALCGPPPPPWSQRGHTHLGKPCPLCALLLDCPAGETRRRHPLLDWGGRCGGVSGIAPPAGGAGVAARPHLYYNRGIRKVFSHRLPCGKPPQANLWVMWSRLRAVYDTFRNDMCHFVTKAQVSCSHLSITQVS